MSNPGTSSKKPPLGLRPRFIVEKLRAEEIGEAIKRYKDAGKEIPAEWIEEQDYLKERAIERQKIMDKSDSPRLMVRGRFVQNDVSVGEWEDFPDVWPPTFRGLYDWMEKCRYGEGKTQYNPLGLIRNASFADQHIVSYGDKYQFLVATDPEFETYQAEEVRKSVGLKDEKPGRVVCTDDCGDVGLTKGKGYEVISKGRNGMIIVRGDGGEVREYFQERFK